MIAKYNAGLILRALLAVVLSIISYIITIAFFYFAFSYVSKQFDLEITKLVILLATSGCVIFITVTGLIRWRAGIGHDGYESMDPFSGIDHVSGSSMVVAHYAGRVTGPAHVISQIALAGPIQLMKVITSIRSIVPRDAKLEAELRSVLDDLRSFGKWRSIGNYAGKEKEISLLVRMELIDFSPRTGKLKA